MTPTERQRIEKELYKYIDTFCGGRENHTPILIEQLLTLIASERDKARNQAIDEALKLLTNYAGSFDIRENYTSFKYQLEALKNNQLT